MKFSGNSFILKLLLVFFASRLQISVSASMTKDLSLKLIDFGMKFAPAPAQDLLKTILKAAVEGIDGHLNPEVKTNDNALLMQNFDTKIDGLGFFVKRQCEDILEQLDEIQVGNNREIMNRMLRELNEFKEYYNEKFVTCVIGKRCTAEMRENVIGYWLNPHSQLRTNLDRFKSEYVVRSSSYETEYRIFDIVRKVAAKSKAGKRLEWAHHESVQNSIYNFYKYITGSVSRMYYVILYCMIEKYVDGAGAEKKPGSMFEIDSLIEKFKGDVKEISIAAQNALIHSPRDIRPDDPLVYTKHENYDRLTRFISAYLIESARVKKTEPSTLDFKNDQTGLSAQPNELVGLVDKDMSYHRGNLEIQGYYVSCEPYFSEVHSITIDHSDKERLYDHFEATDKNQARQTYGKISKKNGSLKTYDIRTKNLFTKKNIPFNVCYMDYTASDVESVRSFSNAPVIASAGKVITGIRWVIRNGVVCMDIQEGKLVEGSIDRQTVQWKITEEDISDVIFLDRNKRSFNLDDVILDKNYFLTGVQFFSDGNSLSLKAYGSKVDNEGTLDGSKPRSFFADPDISKREEVKIDQPDVPEGAPHYYQHEVRGTPGKHYVKFQPTDLKKDAGQTTIPYLDIQPISTEPPAPLGGVGTYYKGMPGFGGFVGLKLISAEILSILQKENIENSFAAVQRKMGEKKRQSRMKKLP